MVCYGIMYDILKVDFKRTFVVLHKFAVKMRLLFDEAAEFNPHLHLIIHREIMNIYMCIYFFNIIIVI